MKITDPPLSVDELDNDFYLDPFQSCKCTAVNRKTDKHTHRLDGFWANSTRKLTHAATIMTCIPAVLEAFMRFVGPAWPQPFPSTSFSIHCDRQIIRRHTV
jgi:hypothetical protein